MRSPLALQLAEFASRTTAATLPQQVRDDIPKRLIDTLGIAVRARTLATSHAAVGFVTGQGGSPQASVIGLEQLVPASWAAFANGVFCHSLDYDDSHLESVLHPSATVIPAAIAAAELRCRSGPQLIAAIAAGLEVCIRLGMAGVDHAQRTSTYFEHGQHATSICGALGAATAVAMLLGLDRDGIASAIGAAASMSSGVIEANRSGGTIKRIHCGWAAHSGVCAAQLAHAGITAPATVLEGRFGFFQAFLHGHFDSAAVMDGLGEDWRETEIVCKPYPANHFTHPVIDAALELRAGGLDWRSVESVEVGVAKPVIRTVGEPIAVKRAPRTGYMAQFSAPYVFAAALIGGGGLGLNLDDFADTVVTEPDRVSLMRRISVVPDSAATAAFPRRFGAFVRVRKKDGQNIDLRVEDSRGGLTNPLTHEDLAAKYADNTAGLVDAEIGEGIRESLLRLENLDDVSRLLRPLARIGHTPGT